MFFTIQEYTDDSGESTDPEEIAIENEYFSSKALKEDDPKAALGGFQRVLELDTKKGEWGFKALKQMLKILFRMVSTNEFALGTVHVYTCIDVVCHFVKSVMVVNKQAEKR